jgi:hypothetical protein
MGWLFTQGQTRAGLIEELTRGSENEHAKWTFLKRYCSGNVLWTVTEITRKDNGQTDRFIGCFLLDRKKDYGWGYKDMEESMGPFYYSCPLSFLDMVPVANEEWRKGVREYHARRNQKLEVGQTVRLTDGKDYKIAKVRPLRAYGPDGVYYRIPRRMLPIPNQGVA